MQVSPELPRDCSGGCPRSQGKARMSGPVLNNCVRVCLFCFIVLFFSTAVENLDLVVLVIVCRWKVYVLRVRLKKTNN